MKEGNLLFFHLSVTVDTQCIRFQEIGMMLEPNNTYARNNGHTTQDKEVLMSNERVHFNTL